jgi:hypothetical protein
MYREVARMPTAAEALTLAQAGWAVIPLVGKIPTTAHGVKDATTDPVQIQRWWERAQHNIGGRVPASLVVLDVDPQNGGSLAALESAAGVPLPETLTVHSGRGTGGQHLYYLHPGGPLTSSRLPKGIDVKTERGYCVMPPSVHPLTGKPYWWEARTPVVLPFAVVALLRPPRPRQVHPTAHAGGGELSARALHLAQFVQNLPEGKRNAGLFWAACRAVEDGHPPLTFDLLEAAASVAGLSTQEAQSTIASARRQGGAR